MRDSHAPKQNFVLVSYTRNNSDNDSDANTLRVGSALPPTILDTFSVSISPHWQMSLK